MREKILELDDLARLMSQIIAHIQARWPRLLMAFCVAGTLYGGAALHRTLYGPTPLTVASQWGALGLLLVSSAFILTRKPWRQVRAEREALAAQKIEQLRLERKPSHIAYEMTRLEVQSRGLLATCWHTLTLRFGVFACVCCVMSTIVLELVQIKFALMDRYVHERFMLCLIIAAGGSMLVAAYGVIRALSTWISLKPQRQMYRDMETLREQRFQGMVPGELSMSEDDTTGALSAYDEDTEPMRAAR